MGKFIYGLVTLAILAGAYVGLTYLLGASTTPVNASVFILGYGSVCSALFYVVSRHNGSRRYEVSLGVFLGIALLVAPVLIAVFAAQGAELERTQLTAAIALAVGTLCEVIEWCDC